MDAAGGDYKTREKKMNHRGTETQRREEKREKRKKEEMRRRRERVRPLYLSLSPSLPLSLFLHVSVVKKP
jgi:hypothetical protein